MLRVAQGYQFPPMTGFPLILLLALGHFFFCLVRLGLRPSNEPDLTPSPQEGMSWAGLGPRTFAAFVVLLAAARSDLRDAFVF